MDMYESKMIMLINTMEIKAGRLEQFRETVERAVAFAEEHGPQLTGFARFPEVAAVGE